MPDLDRLAPLLLLGLLGLLALPPPLAAQTPDTTGDVRQLVAFRLALEHYAGGDAATAVGLLTHLEPNPEDPQPDRFVPEVERLAAGHPGVLLAVATLYGQLYQNYLAQGAVRFADQVGRRVQALVALYVEASGRDDAPRHAAWTLAVAGATAREYGLLGDSAAFFQAALKFNPTEAAALHGLAAFEEKNDSNYLASSYLEPLLAAHPDNQTARLRLAVVKGKAGKTQQATELLQQVVASDGPEWAAIVASQELARLEARSGDVAAAIATLEAARRRFPDDERLALQLSYLLRSDVKASLALIAELTQSRWSQHPPPRTRYNQWPREEFHAARDALAHHVETLLPYLQGALASAALP